MAAGPPAPATAPEGPWGSRACPPQPTHLLHVVRLRRREGHQRMPPVLAQRQHPGVDLPHRPVEVLPPPPLHRLPASAVAVRVLKGDIGVPQRAPPGQHLWWARAVGWRGVGGEGPFKGCSRVGDVAQACALSLVE